MRSIKLERGGCRLSSTPEQSTVDHNHAKWSTRQGDRTTADARHASIVQWNGWDVFQQMCDFVSVQRIERGRKQLFGFVRGQIHEKHDKVWYEVCRRAIRATATRGWTYGGWIGFSIVRGIFFFWPRTMLQNFSFWLEHNDEKWANCTCSNGVCVCAATQDVGGE